MEFDNRVLQNNEDLKEDHNGLSVILTLEFDVMTG